MICEIISANLGDAQSDGQNCTSQNLVLYMVPRVHVCTLDGTFLCTESLHLSCIICTELHIIIVCTLSICRLNFCRSSGSGSYQ